MPEAQREYSMEVVDHAEALYCADGHTLEQVGSITGVSLPTLKRWSVQYEWTDKRENIRKARSAIRTNRVLLHAKLIEKCLTSLNPMDAFAVSSIEGVLQRAAQLAAKGQAREAQPEKLREIRTEADAIAALEEAVESRINRMLANPDGLSFTAMKDLKGAIDLLKEMKSKQPAADAGKKQQGMSKTAVEEIKQKILGVG